jgi:hypothetical protein
MIYGSRPQTRLPMRHTSKHIAFKTCQKRFIPRRVALPKTKAGAQHSGQALAPWLALAGAALTGASTTPRRGIAINQINAAAVIEILRLRNDFPTAAKAIGAQRDFADALTLGHQVAQVIHALAGGAVVGPLPAAALRRDKGALNIHLKPARSKRGKETATVVVSGFEPIDFFLSAIDRIDARRILRCELAECAQFFWAARGHSRCCCKAHTALCRLRRFRARSKEYEQRRKEKFALGQ